MISSGLRAQLDSVLCVGKGSMRSGLSCVGLFTRALTGEAVIVSGGGRAPPDILYAWIKPWIESLSLPSGLDSEHPQA